jgi:hypothetical protein
MIWIPKRPKFNPGKVNAILAFKWVGLQFIVNEQTKKQWAFDLVPGLIVASNPWIYLGTEVTWLGLTLGIFITRPEFNEGLKEEQKIIEEIRTRKASD